MRLNTFIFTLCVCALHVRAASISSEKKLDDLDNVDLDNVAVEPELIDQVTVTDVDNHLRKTVVDIPVKIVEEQKVLDENSNDYVPSNEDNVIIKRVEIDLNNPGPPQRQEHETQNPENYGEMEKALFGIKSSIDDTKNIFAKGLQGVSNSLNTLLENSVDIPAIQQNIQHLRLTFTEQFVKLNETIRSSLLNISPEKNEQSEKSLEAIESGLENIKANFKNGIDTLNEGVEVLTILKEEDDIAKVNPKSVPGEDEAVKADAPENKPQTDNAGATGSTGSTVATGSPAQNPIQQFLTGFQNSVTNAMNGFSSLVQNTFGGGNPQNQPQGQQSQNTIPTNAQSDTVVPAETPASTPAPWSPQGFFQQVQNSWQNLFNGGQNNQQPPQQTVQPANPISQAIQNIAGFIQNPGQAFQQQPPALVSNPSPTPGKVPEQPSTTNNKPENVVQADAIPLATQPVQQTAPVQQPAPQAVPIQQPQPVQGGPIQQLVQNNPIIKGIQSAVNRIQSPPKADTPRNDIVKNEDEEESGKGKFGNNQNQGNSDIDRVEETEEKKEENVISTKGEEEIVEGEIKVEETKIPSLSEKTEEVVV